MGSILTTHARTRMQQRGIPAAAVEALLDFGRVRHLHEDGCEIEPGLDPHVELSATIQQPGSDADPSNDSDSARVEIVPRSGG